MNSITVSKRDFTTKAKKLRRSGMVPGNVFGGKLQEPVAIQMDVAAANNLIRNKREGSKLILHIDGQAVPVQMKEKEINILNNEILHISFQALTDDQKVKIDLQAAESEIVFRLNDKKHALKQDEEENDAVIR